MSIAQRPELSPAMRHADLTSYVEACQLLATFDATGGDALKSLAICPDDPEFGGRASTSEVAFLLWKRKPPVDGALLRLRSRSLSCSRAAETEAVVEEMQRTMRRYEAARKPSDIVDQAPIELRDLRIVHSNVALEDLEVLSALLYGHSSLANLTLQANYIQPTQSPSMKRFALAVSLSNLRTLELSNNPIGPKGVCTLLDHLHTPCLRRLYLSMTMQREDEDALRTDDSQDSWKEEMDKLSHRLVQLAQPDASRAPYAPNLELLTLNGNDLGWRCVRRLVKAIGSGSRRLREVGLFSTLDDDAEPGGPGGDDRDSDSDDDDQQDPALRRSTSIGQFVRSQRSAEVARQIENEVRQLSDHPVTATASSNVGQAPEKRTTEDKVTRQTWRRMLQARLKSNQEASTEVQDASRKLLRVARTLTCKSHPSSETPSKATFQFTRLPAEVRQAIVKQVDGSEALSRAQVERVLSFASDPSTIGYGHLSANLGLSVSASDAIKRQANDIKLQDLPASSDQQYGLLPHMPFRWAEVFATQSVPRDWPAAVLDEPKAPNRKATAPAPSLQSSGGDEGVRTSRRRRSNENLTDLIESTARREQSPSPQVSVDRRTWLEEQPGLQAFWEATGTLASEA